MTVKRKWLLAVICVVALLSSTISFAANDNLTDVKQSGLQVSADKVLAKNKARSVTDTDSIVPGKLVVKFKDGSVTVQKRALQSLGNSMIKTFDTVAGNNVVLVSLSENADLNETIELISKQPNVEFAEPLYIFRALGSENTSMVTEAESETVTDAVYGPNDPYYRKKWQWGLQAINVTDIWERVPVKDREDVTIAIVDTGVDRDHPDLKDSIIEGYDFVNDDDDPDDDNGHGTHVAGIAAAITNNGVGIAGVAGGAKIMPVKVLSAEGSGTSLQVYLGIMYAAKNGADVINMSLGADAPSQLIKEAVEYAVNNGVVVVAATGNDGEGIVDYPAAFDGVIGVGAVDWSYVENETGTGEGRFIMADFSNYGEGADVFAPGVDILSTYPEELDTVDGIQDGYTLLNGTSMATPFAAGMAALLKAEGLSSDEIAETLQNNVYDKIYCYDDDFKVYYDLKDIYNADAGVINGGSGEAKVPEIVEFPNIMYEISRIYTDYSSPFRNNDLKITVYVQKAKGVTDETFKGTVSIIPNLYLSSPVSGYLYAFRDLGDSQFRLKNSDAEGQPDGSIQVKVEEGVGITSYTSPSGTYFFTVDPAVLSYGYIGLRDSYIYPVLINDVSVSGNIRLDTPVEKDMKLYIFGINEIYSQLLTDYLYYGYVDLQEIDIPANTQTVTYSVYLPKDTNYKIYYAIQSDNDIFYNYGFYKDTGTTTDPEDYTPVDLTKGSQTGIDLNITTVEDLDDDVSDKRAEATVLSVEEFDKGNLYELEYKGDRDFFKVNIEKDGKYTFYALPKDYNNPRITIYDLSGNIVLSDYYYTVPQYLAAGTYYIKVEDETGLNTGKYWLELDIEGETEPEEPEYTVVEFEDENLENAIRDMLGKSVSEAVYADDVFDIEILDVSGLNISSVKGLEYFRNLAILDISNNNIKDLSPLIGLSYLEELDAGNNRISKLPDDLSGLTSLYHLNLKNNELTDISPLKTLKSELESLFLQNNKIRDISALANLKTLKVLYLGGNLITDYSPVKSYYKDLRDKDFTIPSGGSGGSGGYAGGGSGSASGPSAGKDAPVKEITTDENGNKVLTVDATQLKLSWDTDPVIDATSETGADSVEIKLSADIFRASAENDMPFSIVLNNVTFSLQPGTINIPEGAGEVTLKVAYTKKLPAGLQPNYTIAASPVYEFHLTVDGNAVTAFEKPVTITLKLSNVNNPDKTGVYCINEEDGSWVFMGGKVNEDRTITFSTPHFSKFQAMESIKTFSDIKDHWAKEDIEIMAARYVTNGTGNNKFSPDLNITRAEFAALIVRALNIAEKTSENPFVDVKDEWFADAALRAHAAGIVQGNSKGCFMPGNMITREEMAAIIVRAYSYYSGKNLNSIITTQEIRFKDMDAASEWARKSITLADALGLMNGMPDKTFRPKAYATRAEAVVVVKRLMKLLGIF